jgi:hypothetical protein
MEKHPETFWTHHAEFGWASGLSTLGKLTRTVQSLWGKGFWGLGLVFRCCLQNVRAG